MELVINHLLQQLHHEELLKMHIKQETGRQAIGIKTSPIPVQNPEYAKQLEKAISILKGYQK